MVTDHSTTIKVITTTNILVVVMARIAITGKVVRAPLMATINIVTPIIRDNTETPPANTIESSKFISNYYP